MIAFSPLIMAVVATLPIIVSAHNIHVSMFENMNRTFASTEFRGCSYACPCFTIQNKYSRDISVYGEITIGGAHQYLGSPRLVLKPKEVALVHSPTLGEWTGAVRAHFLCSDKICGLEHSMTKVEWTSKPHEKLSGRRKWWVNLSLVDGYNLGTKVLMNKINTHTAYIPPNLVRDICPPAQLLENEGTFTCRTDCNYARTNDYICCTGIWTSNDGPMACRESSSWLKPFANQAYFWPHDNPKVLGYTIHRLVKIEFGIHDITNLLKMVT